MTNKKVGQFCSSALSKVSVLIEKPKYRLLPTFSTDFTLNRQIWLFYAEKWIFPKKLGTLLNQQQLEYDQETK